MYQDDGPPEDWRICQLDGADDSILDGDEDDGEETDIENVRSVQPENEENKNSGTQVNIINTNARSLCPKIDSLIDCFEEMDGTIGIITETWLADGDSLDRDVRDLANGAGLGMLCLNRPTNAQGVAHGGVALVNNRASCTMERLDLPNPHRFEVLTAVSTLPGYARKLLTVGCYLPPNYPVQRGREALSYIEDVVLELKRKYRDPFIIVGGDFNQWDIGGALQEFPDLREAPVGPTRQDRCIDRIFTNFGRAISECGTVPPLEPEPGQQGCRSDHNLPSCVHRCLGTGPLNGCHTNIGTSTLLQWNHSVSGWLRRTGRM